MVIFLFIFVFVIIFFIYKNIFLNKNKNKNLLKFKKNFLSKEADIEKIFLRDDEKKSSDPNINISIKINDKEEIIKRKSNIHRARLAKFKKSMLNGEMLFIDEEKKIYKFIDGNKIYIK